MLAACGLAFASAANQRGRHGPYTDSYGAKS
jgi:hypothetical protein